MEVRALGPCGKPENSFICKVLHLLPLSWKKRRGAVSRASWEIMKRMRTEAEHAGKRKGQYNEDALKNTDCELASSKCYGLNRVTR